MLWGFHEGGLELRRRGGGSFRLRGSFPYGKPAVLSDGGKTGRPRKEIIAPYAFAYRIDLPDEDIHLLVGHSYDKPLASRGAGTLDIRETEDALIFEASIAPEMEEVSYVRDFIGGMSAGLIAGVSPGFRIPPPRTVPDAESIEEEDPRQGTAIIRTVHQALLYELSAVTRPAYKDTQIEARNWTPELQISNPAANANALKRWRL